MPEILFRHLAPQEATSQSADLVTGLNPARSCSAKYVRLLSAYLALSQERPAGDTLTFTRERAAQSLWLGEELQQEFCPQLRYTTPTAGTRYNTCCKGGLAGSTTCKLFPVRESDLGLLKQHWHALAQYVCKTVRGGNGRKLCEFKVILCLFRPQLVFTPPIITARLF